jgi:hypothetical protein
MTFSFIDHGHRDFVRDHDGSALKLEFNSWEEADNFIMEGGLVEYGWSNDGTRKWCWDDDEDE